MSSWKMINDLMAWFLYKKSYGPWHNDSNQHNLIGLNKIDNHLCDERIKWMLMK